MARWLVTLLVLVACSPSPARVESPQLEAADLAAVASAFGESPGSPTPRLLAFHGPVLVVLRRDGRRVSQAWSEGSDWWTNLAQAALQARQASRETPTSAETCLTYDYQPHLGKLGGVHRGVLGLQVEVGGTRSRLAPTEMLARNLSFPRAIKALGPMPSDQVTVTTYKAEQVLVQLGQPPTARGMARGNELIGEEAVTRQALESMSAELADWLLANLEPDGRLVYKYWPSRGEESEANNPLRQFMATWVLEQWPSAREQAARNLSYNLKAFYRPGEIVYRDEVKLGAMAIAALALLDSSERKRYASELESLCGTIESLARPDGSFRTFLRPKKRENDNQNFYSGEAQLLRARLYLERPTPRAKERFLKSFGYYREFFRRQPNPAFVPWHTRALVLFYSQEPDPELRDFVFEMNDWLLDRAAMQEWDNSPYPDLKGRFYNERRPDYGPPHASSTGAYMEGLAEAYRLARDLGDTGRAERYMLALKRGARHLMQLQFRDEVDMFYVARPQRVRGGLRTEVYDNEIRVDNVQHALSAIQALLEVWPQGQR